MLEEKQTNELKEEELEKVTGGAIVCSCLGKNGRCVLIGIRPEYVVNDAWSNEDICQGCSFNELLYQKTN